MAGRLPGDDNRSFSDEDSRLDQLAISATSASNQAVSSDTIAEKALEEERTSTQRKIRLCIWAFVAIVLLIVVLAGLKFYKRYAEARDEERAEAALVAKELAEQTELNERTTTTRQTVASLLKQNEMDEALDVLNRAEANGLPSMAFNELKDSIEATGQAHRNDLVSQAEAALDSGSVEGAQALIDDIDALSSYDGGDTRLRDIQERIVVMLRERELVPGRALFAQCRAALEKQEWDEARQLLEAGGNGPHISAEYQTLADELRETIGGRLQITVDPPEAVLQIWDERRQVGEVLFGFNNGKVEFRLDAEGYVPQIQDAAVRYPDVTRIDVTLKAEAPAPLWAVMALSGQCAQDLAGKYYAQKYKDEPWVGTLEHLVRPCVVDLPEEENPRRKLTRKRKAALVEQAIETFRHDVKQDPIAAMNTLAEFTVVHPDSTKTVLKQCGKRIGRALRPIGKGCSDCLGHGDLACPGCKGIGQRKEQRECPDCDGSGSKVHRDCDGTGKVACSRCNGEGTIRKQVIEDGRPVQRRVTCPKCDGAGKITCAGCRGTGKVSCIRCRGTGKAKIMGPCSRCEGKGRLPCETCDSTGDRDKMDVGIRQDAEDVISRAGDQ